MPLAFLFCCAAATAQLPFKTTNEVSPVLSKIIHDYPNDFKNLKGEIIEEGPQTTSYACLLAIKGIEAPGIITQFGAEKDHVYSWKNEVLQTDNLKTARRLFKQYYTQIKKTNAIINNLEIKLVAHYEEPLENKSFNTIRFRLETVETAVKDVVAELNMQYEMGNWTITISLYHMEDAGNSLPANSNN